MKCPHCGKTHPDDTDFCPKTGQKIEQHTCLNPDCYFRESLPHMAMYCPSCGKAMIRGCDDAISKPFSSEFIYDNIEEYHDGLAKVQRDSKYGFIDEKGHEVIPCKYDGFYGWFENGHCIVIKNTSDDDLYGVIDKNNRLIIPCIYSEIGYDNNIEAFNVTKKNGLCGIISLSGETIIPPIYDSISWFKDGIALAEKNDSLMVVDKFGNIVDTLPSKYSSGDPISDSLFAVKYDEKWGIIDRRGRIKLDFVYDYIHTLWFDSFAVVKQNGKEGLISKEGKMLLPCIYKRLFPSGNKNALAYNEDGYCRIIDVYKNRPLSSYYPFSRFSNGEYHPVENDAGIALLLDSNGQIIIPPTRYNMMTEPKKGMVPVMFHDDDEESYFDDDEDLDSDDYELWGVLDLDGKILIPCMYEHVSIGDNGLIVATYNGQKCIINRNHDMILPNGIDLQEWTSSKKYWTE